MGAGGAPLPRGRRVRCAARLPRPAGGGRLLDRSAAGRARADARAAQFLDRGAAALWPAYRQAPARVRAGRAPAQRRLEPRRRATCRRGTSARGTGGAALRQRRGGLRGRLRAGLERCFRPEGERYDVARYPAVAGTARTSSGGSLQERWRAGARDERRAGRTLVGPHRDTVTLTVDGAEAAAAASAGQARSLLLALALATLEVYAAGAAAGRGGPPGRPGFRARRRAGHGSAARSPAAGRPS